MEEGDDDEDDEDDEDGDARLFFKVVLALLHTATSIANVLNSSCWELADGFSKFEGALCTQTFCVTNSLSKEKFDVRKASLEVSDIPLILEVVLALFQPISYTGLDKEGLLKLLRCLLQRLGVEEAFGGSRHGTQGNQTLHSVMEAVVALVLIHDDVANGVSQQRMLMEHLFDQALEDFTILLAVKVGKTPLFEQSLEKEKAKGKQGSFSLKNVKVGLQPGKEKRYSKFIFVVQRFIEVSFTSLMKEHVRLLMKISNGFEETSLFASSRLLDIFCFYCWFPFSDGQSDRELLGHERGRGRGELSPLLDLAGHRKNEVHLLEVQCACTWPLPGSPCLHEEETSGPCKNV